MADVQVRPRPAVYPARPRTALHVGRQIGAWVFWLAVVANGGVLVWLWVRGGNIDQVHSLAALLTSIGRITGLLGAYLLLLQVLLLARLRWLEQQTGFDRLTVWHRRNGKLCLYLILAHVIFITIGYQQADRISIPSEINALLTFYPGMVTATVGTGLIVLVAVSSFVIVRRQLRFEAWYLVHLTAYAGIVLSWFHEIPTGNELVLNPIADAYWGSLYLATLALLALFRVLQPIARGVLHGLRVDEVIEEGPNVVSLRISGRRLDLINARPGQFFLWRFLNWNRWWEAHPFSLSAAPDGRTFRITVKDLGDFSRRIGTIKPGTRVVAEGPFGTFTSTSRRRERVVLIAGGIGITPIRALIEEMPGNVAVIYRVLREEDLIFREELAEIARERGITLHFVAGDHAAPGGERLMSPDHLRELLPDVAERDIFVCGPPGLANFIEKNVRDTGVPRKHIHTERFAL